MNDNRSWRWIAALILGIGGLIVLGGLALGRTSLALVLHGERAEAEVVELREISKLRAPILSFKLTDGSVREVKDIATASPKLAVGDRVTLLYDAADPDTFRIDDFEALWFASLFTTGFGCFWLMFGLVAWAVSRDVELFVVGETAFGAIATVAALLGVWAVWDAAALLASGSRATGRVVEIRETRTMETEEVGGDRRGRRTVERISYAPLVRFTAADDREIEFLGRGGSGTEYAVGDSATVLYRPEAPAAGRLLTFVDLWLPAAVAWGVVLIFGGGVWLSRRVRRA